MYSQTEPNYRPDVCRCQTPFDRRRAGGASTPPAAGPVKGRLRELVVFGADAVKESDRRRAARRSASTLHGFAIETGDFFVARSSRPDRGCEQERDPPANGGAGAVVVGRRDRPPQ